jgi:hypothetical protein
MFFQLPRLSETLSTLGAVVRLLPCVFSHVVSGVHSG